MYNKLIKKLEKTSFAVLLAGQGAGRLSGLSPARTHFNVVTVVTSQCRFSQCSFCFGATRPPGRLHQFANKVGSLQVVLGWNRQARWDYLFVVFEIDEDSVDDDQENGARAQEVRDKHTN